ncbi:MAG: hypothetical protein ACK5PZ_10180, partial [Pirellula sp.]
PVVVNTVSGDSATGAPEDESIASAQPGQMITISGRSLTTSTLVQFPAVDDTGAFGYLTRTGTPSNDGRTLEVMVPGRAISGNIRVVGSTTTLPLQIVPQIDSIGGDIVPGQTILLSGVGFSTENTNPLSVKIAGLSATVLSTETFAQGVDGESKPLQFLRVLVPVGAAPGSEITVTAFGGGRGTFSNTAVSINSLATSGTPAINNIPSANTSQTITILDPNGGLLSTTQIGFTASTGNGRLYESTVTVSSVSSDGKSAQVIVPSDAITGPVRILGEQGGITLQIVPTLNDIDLSTGNPFHSGNLSLFGTGFVEGGTQIRYAGQEVVDLSNAAFPTEVYSYHDELSTIVPSWASSGPISVRTIGGTSDNFNIRLDSIVATATSGTPKNAAIASANPGQSIRLTGAQFNMSTEVVFRLKQNDGTIYEYIVKPSYVTDDRTQLDVIVPNEATTGVVQVVGDTSGQAIPLQIVRS